MSEITQQDIQNIDSTISEISNLIENNQVDFAEFVRGYNSAYGYYTPDMQNTNMKNINLNPKFAEYADYLKAIKNPKENEDLLISYCQTQYQENLLFKRNYDYICNLLAFDLDVQCENASESDYNSPAYKKDWKTVEHFLNCFNYREQFRKVMFNLLNADIYPCMFRADMDENKYVLQDFPYKYAKITGRSAYGLVCDIDLSFLMSGTQDVRLYPKFIQKKYKSLFDGNGKYIPSATLNSRTGKFAYYVQTNLDEIFTFKFASDFVTCTPYFMPMILDSCMTDLYRQLQMDNNLISAKKIITSEWPLLNDSKTSASDRLAVKSSTMGQIVGKVASSLGSYFHILSVPSNRIEVHSIENTNSAMYTSFLKDLSGLLGGAGVLFSTARQSSVESLISADIDKMLVEKLYPQFENFLEFFINKRTKKFKFKFRFSGTNAYQYKETKVKNAMQAAQVGLLSANKISNAFDMNIFEFKRELEMTHSMGLEKLLTPILNIYTASSGDSSAGRPQKSTSELSDSGEATRENSSNISRGGNI